jgi:hypothetical protein
MTSQQFQYGLNPYNVAQDGMVDCCMGANSLTCPANAM